MMIDKLKTAMELADAYAEKRHVCGDRTYNSDTAAARNALRQFLVTAVTLAPLKPEDLEITTYRGGPPSMLNRMDNGVQIHHIPSGIKVRCESERALHANRDLAFKELERLLGAKPVAPAPQPAAIDRDELIALIAEELSLTYHCTRVWEAWHIGTMSQDDFESVSESDTPAALADAIIAKLAAAPPKADHIPDAGKKVAPLQQGVNGLRHCQSDTRVTQDGVFPMQPIVRAANGVVRFKENRIVSAILEESRKAGYGLNEVACGDFTQEERMQFAQLIGYSVGGYGDLSYASPESVEKADAIAADMYAARPLKEGDK